MIATGQNYSLSQNVFMKRFSNEFFVESKDYPISQEQFTLE